MPREKKNPKDALKTTAEISRPLHKQVMVALAERAGEVTLAQAINEGLTLWLGRRLDAGLVLPAELLARLTEFVDAQNNNDQKTSVGEEVRRAVSEMLIREESLAAHSGNSVDKFHVTEIQSGGTIDSSEKLIDPEVREWVESLVEILYSGHETASTAIRENLKAFRELVRRARGVAVENAIARVEKARGALIEATDELRESRNSSQGSPNRTRKRSGTNS